MSLMKALYHYYGAVGVGFWEWGTGSNKHYAVIGKDNSDYTCSTSHLYGAPLNSCVKALILKKMAETAGFEPAIREYRMTI